MTTPGSHGPGDQPPGGGSGWGPPAGASGGGYGQPGSVPPPPPPGQFPPPQGQYGQAPGQVPRQPHGASAGPGWTPPEQKKSGAGKWIGIGAAILALIVVAVLALAFLGGGDPEAGDCLQEDGEELAVVDCDDDEAAYRIVGVQEGEQTFAEYQADPNTCADFLPESTQFFWVGDQSDANAEGVVYCVTDA